MKRRPITAAMKLEVLTVLSMWPCYRCDKEFWLADMQWDHVQALVDGGEHHPSNLRPVCKGCHREKSAFEHIRNCKTKRIIKKRTQPKKPSTLKSRGFDKTYRKKMNGQVEKQNDR